MRRACEARIADPSLTLLSALKIGGFVFPQDQPTREDRDVDGVRLRQRKNQLSVSYVWPTFVVGKGRTNELVAHDSYAMH